MVGKNLDILEILAEYEKRLAAFKQDMEKLGVKVKVEVSIGPYQSIVRQGG